HAPPVEPARPPARPRPPPAGAQSAPAGTSTAWPAGGPRPRGSRSRRSGYRGRGRSIPVIPGVRHEAGELLLDGELDGADPAVAVLGDDQVRDPFALGLVVVVLVAVDEHHEVRVLLDRP